MSVLSSRAALVAAGFALVASVAHAQAKGPIGQGSWIVGGTAGWSHSAIDGAPNATSTFTLAPSGLYFVRPHIAIGGAAATGYSATGSEHIWTYGIGPDVRYYFGDMSGKLFPFIRADMQPVWSRMSTAGGGADAHQHRWSYEGSAGLTQMLATHVGLTGELFYATARATQELSTTTATVTSSSYGIRFGISAFVF